MQATGRDQSWGPRLLEAAAQAPTAPGVYFLLDDHRALLYIGKAKNVRQRLRQHAQVEPAAGGRFDGRVKARYPLVRHVRWEETASVDDASAREADLIVALRPPDNAWTDSGTWTYIVLTEVVPARRWRFELRPDTPSRGRAYGCFPHLGKGVAFEPAIACSDGYTALLRLLWAASGDGTHMPSRITRSAPERFETTVEPDLVPQLWRLLSGTSDRILDHLALAATQRDAYLQPALRRDRSSAAGFFTYGPRALRQLRRRHGRPPGLLTRKDIERFIADEVAPLLRGAPGAV